MYRNSSDLELGFDDFVGGLQIVGMRFKNVAIPQGATISSAYLEFETDETESGATSVVIFGENVDDANELATVVVISALDQKLLPLPIGARRLGIRLTSCTRHPVSLQLLRK